MQWESLLLRVGPILAFTAGARNDRLRSTRPGAVARAQCGLTSVVAAAILVVGCAIGARSLLTWRLLPWQLVLGVGLLFILVQIAHDHGEPRDPALGPTRCGSARGAVLVPLLLTMSVMSLWLAHG